MSEYKLIKKDKKEETTRISSTQFRKNILWIADSFWDDVSLISPRISLTSFWLCLLKKISVIFEH